MRLRVALLLAVLLTGCGAENPDAEVRAMIEDMETAVEARDTGYFRGVIADSFRDARGNDRGRIIDLIRGFFLANPRIEAIVRVEDVTLDGPDSARVTVQAALLSAAGGRSLLGVDGDLYSADLELLRIDGEWRLIGADWRSLRQ